MLKTIAKNKLLLLFLAALPHGVAQGAEAPKGVTVFSARKEHLIKPVLDQFTKDTNIPVTLLTGDEGPLLERLKAEGAKTTADLLVTVDAGNLWLAAKEGVLTPVKSPALTEAIPAHLRDPEGRWYGLSVRARTMVYNPTKVKPTELVSYEALSEPQWKGKLCLRTSKKVYNQSLVAMMIAEHGAPRTEQIVKGWVANLAAPVFPDDTKVIEAVAAGQCAVGIVNTYYYGRLLRDKPELSAKLFWPNQAQGGVHVNISGAGLVKHAKNPEGAQQLLTWLASPRAQGLFAELNLEYPASPKVAPAKAVEAWGTFKQNTINVSRAGELQAEAVKLMDRAGYQ